jgi:hypothetical protein
MTGDMTGDEAAASLSVPVGILTGLADEVAATG